MRKAFTLLEILVTIALVLAISFPLFLSLSTGRRILSFSQSRLIAHNQAFQALEYLSRCEPQELLKANLIPQKGAQLPPVLENKSVSWSATQAREGLILLSVRVNYEDPAQPGKQKVYTVSQLIEQADLSLFKNVLGGKR